MLPSSELIGRIVLLVLWSAMLPHHLAFAHVISERRNSRNDLLTPRIFIISMFQPEAEVWQKKLLTSGYGNLTAQTIWTPGLSLKHPVIHCTKEADICQGVMSEGEINAASTMMAIVLSRRFDLRESYFILAGIGGVNPRHATLGSVALSRYSVSVALQYELDSRSLPKGWRSGYFGLGTDGPSEYPKWTYGTEVFELNEELRIQAYKWSQSARLVDNEQAARYRAKYRKNKAFTPAIEKPQVVLCDTTTSDVYYSGTRLSEAFEKTMELWSNGTGTYCMTAQEDSAVLAVLVRGAVDELVDFSRVILMRSGSNFDRPPPGMSDWEHLAQSDQNGFDSAIDNLFNVGVTILEGLLHSPMCGFKLPVLPQNYIGDIFGSLGGHPDFGLGSITNGTRRVSGGDAWVELQKPPITTSMGSKRSPHPTQPVADARKPFGHC